MCKTHDSQVFEHRFWSHYTVYADPELRLKLLHVLKCGCAQDSRQFVRAALPTFVGLAKTKSVNTVDSRYN